MTGQLTAAAHAVDARRHRSRQVKLGASDVGTCRRRAGYDLAGTKPTNVQPKMAAILGTWIHKGALEALRRQHGSLIEVTVEDDLLKGHVDRVDFTRWWPGCAIGDPEKYLVDVEDLKTRSVFVMDRVYETGAYRSEWYQAHLYADLLRRGKVRPRKRHGRELELAAAADRIVIRNVSIRFLCRDNGEEHVISRPYDQAVADEAWAWLDEVLDAQEPELLPRDQTGPTTSAICRSCPFLDLCWPPRMDDYARETVLPEEGESVLADYHEHRAVESAAKKAKEAARAQLDGLPAGLYGDFVLGWSGDGKPPSPKPDMDIIRKEYEARGEELPVFWVQPRPSIAVRKAKPNEKLTPGA